MTATENGYTVHVLYNGYSTLNNECTEMKANCTCTLIKGPHNLIVDTMTAWDKDNIIKGLADHGLVPEEINYVICTHGHSDHIGNNNLFLNARHIVGFSISYKDTYYLHPFDEGKPYNIDGDIELIPTPGHTLSDVTVIIKTRNQGIYAVAGDLFECSQDVDEPKLWIEAGSESTELQKKNRLLVANKVDWIIPGHGVPFKSTEEVRSKLEMQLKEIKR